MIRRGDSLGSLRSLGSLGWRPGREHQRDRLRQQAAPDEPEDLGRGLVEPMCVIHHAQQWLLLGRLRHQAERPEGDQERVGVMSRGKSERDADSVSLGLGQRVKSAEHRSAQLVQPGEGKLHLRFDPGSADHPKAGRLPDQVSQQRRLADSRFSPHHQDGTLTASHVHDELVQDLQLSGPAEQLRRGRRGHLELLEHIGHGPLKHSHHAAVSSSPTGPKARAIPQPTLPATLDGSQ